MSGFLEDRAVAERVLRHIDDGSTDRGDETVWRWRCFTIGGMLGMVWGAIYVCVPMVTQAILPRRVELVPMIFLDFTPQLSKYLPAVPFNFLIDMGAFLSGMIVPSWLRGPSTRAPLRPADRAFSRINRPTRRWPTSSPSSLSSSVIRGRP